MLYRPPMPKHMWDCTLFYEEPDYHLFFLSNGNIGHVSTRDFVQYIEYPDIEGHGKEGTWNCNGVPLTGTLVKTGEEYKMLLGTIDPKTLRQVYGLFTSHDLIHWHEYENNPVLESDGNLYQKEVSPRDWHMYTAWRDPYVIGKESDSYILCLCARLKDHAPSSTGAAIAKLKTKDFIHFEICPPFTEVGDFTKYAECPDVFCLDGRTYLLFLDHSWGGLHTYTKSCTNPAGTFYQIYDTRSEKFIFGEERLLLGSSNNRQCAWAARSVAGENGSRLLYYHVTAEYPSFGIPKVIQADKSGALHLRYFSKIDGLCAGPIPPLPRPLPGDCGIWNHSGDTFSGKSDLYGSALPIASAENCLIECTVTIHSGAKAGIAFWQGNDEKSGAAAVWLDAADRKIRTEWAHYRENEGFGDLQEDVVNGGTLREVDERMLPIERDTPYRLKIVAKDRTVDVYLNDEWFLCKRFPMCAESGFISLITERAQADFTISKFYALKDIEVRRFEDEIK